MLFFEKSLFFSSNIEKRFRPFARLAPLCFIPKNGRKWLFVWSCLLGRMPLKELLMLCAGQSRKPAPKGDVSRKRKTNLCWDYDIDGKTAGRWKKNAKKRACCHFVLDNRPFFLVNLIRRNQSRQPARILFLVLNWTMGLSFGLTWLGKTNLRDIKKSIFLSSWFGREGIIFG